ncbi:hypothetical protein SAMN02745866_03101 [Alteromonadaceae bacterium Bs31]|nr:hypothetical protein SAMN02745866_03101 [Alteromonadaceae bacterium Bs31]
MCLMIMLSFVNPAFACKIRNNEAIPSLIFPPKYKAKKPAEDYIFRLIQLILVQAADKYGPCEAKLLEGELPLKRMELYLQKDQFIDAVSLTVSLDRDKRFLPVKIPIAKGLIGFRIFLVRNDDLPRFAAIKNRSDLAQMLAGQGENWTDAIILQENGLPVITTGNIPSLVDMLVHKRFDYFPRGALQLIPELKIYRGLPVVVEPSVALSYPSMTSLYVHHRNSELAERLEYGLEKAYENGSFDALFYSHPSTVTALEKLDLSNRTVIQLCNPSLPSWAPTNKDKYWLQPWPKELQTANCSAMQKPLM